MASKKCPKCGEDNPAEAVMCWACYTPLSGAPGGGGAAVAALGAKAPIGGGAVGSPVISKEEPQKKSIDPRLIGAGAFLLVAGVVGFMVMNSGTGTGDDGTTLGIDPPAASSSGMSSSSSSSTSMQPSTSVAPPMASGGAAPAAVPASFLMVSPPNAQFNTGTMAIMIDSGKASQAAGLARFAKDQISRNGKWQNMQVAVFTDKQTADAFSQFQNKRHGAPLTPVEYSALASQGVWTTTPVFLDSRGKRDNVMYPSKSPYGWWNGR